jgi:hypothetical protein
VKPLVDRAHRGLQHAVDPVLHVDGVVLRLDVNVAGAPLNGRVERRVHKPDHRAGVGCQLLDGERLVAPVIVAENLKLEALRRVFQDALRAFALLEDRLNRRRRADRHLDRRREQHRQLVDHGQIGWIGDDDNERVAFAVVGDEAVPQHQLGRDRPEQLVVDVELRQIHELEPIALREPFRVRDLGRVFRRIRLGDAGVRVEVCDARRRRGSFDIHMSYRRATKDRPRRARLYRPPCIVPGLFYAPPSIGP